MKELKLPLIEKLPEILIDPERALALGAVAVEYPDAPETRRVYGRPTESTLGRLDRLGRL